MIRALPIVLLVALAAGCSGPRVPQKAVPPPPPEPRKEQPAEQRTNAAATQRYLDEEIERRTGRSVPTRQAQRYAPPRYRDAEVLQIASNAPGGGGYANPGQRTDEAATARYIDAELERRRTVEPVAPPERVVERIYVQTPAPRGGYGYSQRSGPGFPINTAVGAGIGAIIGNQSGDAAEGAWIGAGFGLLYDLMR